MSNGLRTPVRVMSVHEMADRIEELEAELEYWRKDSAAAWDKCEEYRLRIEELEARVAAADKLAEAVTHEREMVCQDFGMQQDAATAVHNALAAYQATKEGE